MSAVAHAEPAAAAKHGRHHWPKRGPLDSVGRRIITDPVPADYWPPDVPRRDADAPTAVIPAVPVTPAPWFVPAGPTSTGDVIAEMRADLTAPPATDTKDSPA